MEQRQEYLDTKQLSVKLNVSIKTLNKWVQAGHLPVIKMGRLNRFSINEIEKKLLSGALFLPKFEGQE